MIDAHLRKKKLRQAFPQVQMIFDTFHVWKHFLRKINKQLTKENDTHGGSSTPTEQCENHRLSVCSIFKGVGWVYFRVVFRYAVCCFHFVNSTFLFEIYCIFEQSINPELCALNATFPPYQLSRTVDPLSRTVDPLSDLMEETRSESLPQVLIIYS